MAKKNEITCEGTAKGLLFKGSLRQPTLVEIANYCHENGLNVNGLYLTQVRIGGEWVPPEEVRGVHLIEYGEECPVCGHEFDFSKEWCPICHRRWQDDG